MNLMILNGPNLNLLGEREIELYGTRSFTDYLKILEKDFPQIDFNLFQSNHEGALIDKIQEIRNQYDGVIINLAGYTHTSLALADALRMLKAPVIEVHLTNLYRRGPDRQRSLSAGHTEGVIMGFGLESYRLAVEYLVRRIDG